MLRPLGIGIICNTASFERNQHTKSFGRFRPIDFDIVEQSVSETATDWQPDRSSIGMVGLESMAKWLSLPNPFFNRAFFGSTDTVSGNCFVDHKFPNHQSSYLQSGRFIEKSVGGEINS